MKNRDGRVNLICCKLIDFSFLYVYLGHCILTFRDFLQISQMSLFFDRSFAGLDTRLMVETKLLHRSFEILLLLGNRIEKKQIFKV